MAMNRIFPPESNAVGSINDQLAYLSGIKLVRPVQSLSRDQISALVETAFWACLIPNEGRYTRICTSVAAREHFPNAIAFAKPVEFDEAQIAKLAPAVSRDGCLVASVSGEGFTIWGVGPERRDLRVYTVSV